MLFVPFRDLSDLTGSHDDALEWSIAGAATDIASRGKPHKHLFSQSIENEDL